MLELLGKEILSLIISNMQKFCVNNEITGHKIIIDLVTVQLNCNTRITSGVERRKFDSSWCQRIDTRSVMMNDTLLPFLRNVFNVDRGYTQKAAKWTTGL